MNKSCKQTAKLVETSVMQWAILSPILFVIQKSYKNWALDTNQLLVVYKALIRSYMEYAPPVLL